MEQTHSELFVYAGKSILKLVLADRKIGSQFSISLFSFMKYFEVFMKRTGQLMYFDSISNSSDIDLHSIKFYNS
jgi:hypothetical protein